MRKTNYMACVAFILAAIWIVNRNPPVSPKPAIVPKETVSGFVAQEVIRGGVKTYVFVIDVNATIAQTAPTTEPQAVSTYDLINNQKR